MDIEPALARPEAGVDDEGRNVRPVPSPGAAGEAPERDERRNDVARDEELVLRRPGECERFDAIVAHDVAVDHRLVWFRMQRQQARGRAHLEPRRPPAQVDLEEENLDEIAPAEDVRAPATAARPLGHRPR